MEEGATIAPNGLCATPTIIISNNRIHFDCETPNAEFTSTVTTAIEEHNGNEVVIGNNDIVYVITVYANAPGYEQSKPAKATIKVSRGDVNVDGGIDVADLATIISIMASKRICMIRWLPGLRNASVSHSLPSFRTYPSLKKVLFRSMPRASLPVFPKSET